MTVKTSADVGPIGIDNSRLARWSMYAIMMFPLIDFGLRFTPLHPLGVIWDKVLLLVLVVLAVSRYIAGFRPYWFQWNRFAGWFILLTAGIMFAGLAGGLVSVSGFKIDIYYILYALLIPFLVDAKDVPKLLHAGAALAILIAVDGIFQYVTKVPNVRGWVGANESVRTRVFSVIQSPNELGSYMAFFTPLIAGMALYETDKWRKRLYMVGVPLCSVTLLLTYTRGAWVALAFALFIMAVLFERRLLIVLIIFAAVAFFLPPIHHRIADLLSPVYWINSAKSGRVFKWITAFDKMGSNPLFGIGLGRFGGAVASQSYGSIYSDNYYAKILAETGLVGLTMFLAMHLSLIRELFSKSVRRASGRMRFVVIGGTTGLIAILIHNTMENVFEFAPMAITYFTYATLFLIWGTGHLKQSNMVDGNSVTEDGGQA